MRRSVICPAGEDPGSPRFHCQDFVKQCREQILRPWWPPRLHLQLRHWQAQDIRLLLLQGHQLPCLRHRQARLPLLQGHRLPCLPPRLHLQQRHWQAQDIRLPLLQGHRLPCLRHRQAQLLLLHGHRCTLHRLTRLTCCTCLRLVTATLQMFRQGCGLANLWPGPPGLTVLTDLTGGLIGIVLLEAKRCVCC